MDNKEVQICKHCGKEISGDECRYFDGQVLCADCLDSQTTFCSHCGERIWNYSNIGTLSMPLCQRCYDDYYTTCERCGRIIHQHDANYPDDGDDPYCNTCWNEMNASAIRVYSYKPKPIFYGNGNRFFGVELEIDHGGQDRDNAEVLLDIGNSDCERIYIKSDGSLDDGMEIVTHPMSLDYHRFEMPWQEICQKGVSMKYRSHKTRTCGLHIHVNRDTFGRTPEAQDSAISRVLYFIEHH